MKKITLVFAVIAITLFSCTRQAEQPSASKVNSEVASKKGGKNSVTAVLGSTATITLTHNADSTFSIDYGGATDVVWVFPRGGNELSATSGNVIPIFGQSFYLNPVTTFNMWGSAAYYQVVVATGDANDAAGWTFNYSNVVQ